MTADQTLTFADALNRIAEAAPERDRDGAGLDAEIGWLHQAGALVDALPETLTGVFTWADDPPAVAERMRALGRASLPVGRLLEGHVNAAQLIGLYGHAPLREKILNVVADGALLGVWGANGPSPVRAERRADAGFRLAGAKLFCSGLGLVQYALVSAALENRTALFCVEVTNLARMDQDQWDVSGMRATRSGGYDFEGVTVSAEALVGDLDAYFREPYFLGGMYRFCAVQVGGLEALLDATISAIQRRGQAENLMAHHRVGSIASDLAMAGATTDDLAGRIATGGDAQRIARQAVLTREGVERCIVHALETVERALGTELHRETTRLSMLRRDLSFYIRQAAVDDRLISVGRSLCRP